VSPTQKERARKDKPGRPRSEAARQAILEAALGLVQAEGYAKVSVEGIATRAGVGKQTIYRWWPGKAQVILEALSTSAASDVEVPDTGSLREDLEVWLRSTFRAGRREPYRSVLPALMAAAQLDPDFAAVFRGEFLAERRRILQTMLERAHERGEWSSELRFETLLDVVFGVLWYRLLVRYSPLDKRLADELTDVILNARRKSRAAS
jgi:AcrR family transcriptional regulator